MVAFQALGLVTGAILLLQNVLQGQCSPLSRRALPPHLPANLTAILTNGTNDIFATVELEISPFPVHVSYIASQQYYDFMEVVVPKIDDDAGTLGRDTEIPEGRWELSASGLAILYVKDAHYTGEMTYGMIDDATTQLYFMFPLFDFRESNLRVYEHSEERRLISRGYIAKTVRGTQGPSLAGLGGASTNSVSVTR